MRFLALIPTFNAEAFVGRALSSLRDQGEGVDLRVFVLDDGSTDGTRDVVRRVMQDSHGWAMMDREHRGVTETVADLWSEATLMDSVDLVFQLDADDWLRPRSLPLVQRLFQANPWMEWLYTDQWVRSEGENGSAKRTVQMARPLGSCPGVCSQPLRVVKQEILGRLGPLRRDLPAMPDFDLALRLERLATGFYLPLPLYERLVRPGSVSQSQRRAQQEAAHMLGLLPEEVA